MQLDGPAVTADVVAVAEPMGNAPAAITEARIIVEEVTAEVLVVLTARPADGDRPSLDVELTLPSTGQEATVTLSDREPAARVSFVLPLTDAVVPTTVRWRVLPPAGGDPSADWHDHDLTSSAVIAIDDSTTADDA